MLIKPRDTVAEPICSNSGGLFAVHAYVVKYKSHKDRARLADAIVEEAIA